jgi:hypothetical protein
MSATETQSSLTPNDPFREIEKNALNIFDCPPPRKYQVAMRVFLISLQE